MALTDFDLRLLQIFVAIAENRGLSPAQTSLNLNLSTISLHLSTLEGRLGMKLCERGRSGFRLTEEGDKVLQIAHQLTGAVSVANTELAHLRNILIGKLRLGLVDNLISNPASRISESIHVFDQRKHEVAVTIEIVSPLDLERKVSDGIVDIGIGPKIQGLGSLEYDALFSERQYLYCGHSHPLFDAAPDEWTSDLISLQKFANHICPLPEGLEYSGFRDFVVVHNMESVAYLVLSGGFIGFLPEHYAKQWVVDSMMRPIRPDVYRYDNLFFGFSARRQRASRVISKYRKDLKNLHAAAQSSSRSV